MRITKTRAKKEGSSPKEKELVAELVIDVPDGAEDAPPIEEGGADPRAEERSAELECAIARLQQEISERKEAEEILRTRERYLQSLIEKSSDGVLVIDSEGAPTYRYLPVAFEDIHPNDLQSAISALRQIAKDPGAKARTEVRVRHKDGTWRYAEVTGTNYLHDPEMNGMVLYFRDITDYNQSEEALRARARYFQSLIERSSDGILVIDSRGIPIYRYLPMAFEEIHPHDLQAAISSLTQIAEERDGKVLTEVRVQHGDGTWRYAEVTGTNYLNDPEVRGLVLSFRDITDRKHVEEKLEAAHKELVQIAREAGMAEVATNVLHNVGNVVNSVGITTSSIQQKLHNSRVANLGKVAAMMEEHKDDLSEFLTNDERGQKLPAYISSLAEHLIDERNRLDSEARMLLEHVQHIIDIIKIQQSYGMARSFTELVVPAEIMEDALRIDESVLTRDGVHVKREFEDLPATMIDRHRTMQILTNLISNAKEAILQNEQSSKVLELSVKKADEDHIQFEVTDDGIGIAEDQIQWIFSQGYTTRQDGHGFGLHSAANAAKEMGGSLGCRSEGLGKGATFTLEIPISQKGDGNGNEH